MRAHPPASSCRFGGKRKRAASWRHTWKKPPSKTEWKAWDLPIYMKKSDGFKKKKQLKNTEIQLVVLRPPLFCCHNGWGTHWLLPDAPANTVPLFLQWQSAARRWNSWTNIRDLFLPERGEKQQSISIFIFSHSFYLPQVCILYAWLRLCLVQWWVVFFFVFFSSCITRSYLWYKKASWPCVTCFTCMRSLKKKKNGCMFAFPYLWLYFSLTTK